MITMEKMAWCGIGAKSFTKHLTFPMMTMAKMAGCDIGCQILNKTSHLPRDENGQDGFGRVPNPIKTFHLSHDDHGQDGLV